MGRNGMRPRTHQSVKQIDDAPRIVVPSELAPRDCPSCAVSDSLAQFAVSTNPVNRAQHSVSLARIEQYGVLAVGKDFHDVR